MSARWSAILAAVVATVVVVLAAGGRARAQGPAGAGLWTVLERMPPEQALTDPWVRPVEGVALRADYARVAAELSKAPMEGTPGAANPLTFELVHPSGVVQRFAVVESPVMEPALYAQHPEMRQYRGQGIDDPDATARLVVSPLGFAAMVLTWTYPEGKGGAWYVDAYTRGDASLYTSYWLRDAEKERAPFTCTVLDDGFRPGPALQLRSTLGGTLRTYRLAMATTAEYTAWAGGAANALAQVTSSASQLSLIYEREFAVRFTLVATNANVIYTAANDPFSTPDNGSSVLNQATAAYNAAIGSANFDIGHTLHKKSSNDGIAQLSAVCRSTAKAQGYSSGITPSSATFVIDYVAHEVGHQCGGRHTHSNCNGSAGDSAQYLVEPGSASTIMGYAGICGGTDLQPNSDAYFNGLNIEQIITYLSGTSCAVSTSTGNTPPTVSAGPAFTIPAKTPFTLTATGSDANGDPVVYCWEEQDGGSLVTYPPVTGSDTGTGPLVRSRSATSSPSRSVPRLSTVLANTTDPQEWLPQVGRSMAWRVTARDNRSGGGGVNQADVTLTVAGGAGPFQVTGPATSATLSGSVPVTWSVAGTNAAPVSCANVRITLSTDGGSTFPTVLAASTPNDGSETVTLPSVTTSQARVRVEGLGNIFYAVNPVNFAITPPPPSVSFAVSGTPAVADAAFNGNGNGLADPGENNLSLTVALANSGTATATGVSATLTSTTATATVVSGASAYPSIGPGSSQSNSTPFVIALSPSHPCGQPVTLSLAVTSAQGSGTAPVSIATGAPAPGAPVTFQYSTPVAIPDATSVGVNSTLTVSGVGTVWSVAFRFDGSFCSTGVGSGTVGLSHSAVGDLVVKLTSPAGTTVTIMERPGGSANTGNNFCNTVLQDGAANPIQDIVASGAPWQGTFAPRSPLSAFNGQNANGAWTLNVADFGAGDTGSVRAWSLVITPVGVACSAPAQPTGACCAPAGSCTVVSQAACAGAYQGDNAACTPVNPCPPPAGACCASSGSCSSATQAACAGAWQGALTACSPNPCPQPTGACCAADGSCTVGVTAACSSGAFQGTGTACSPNPCPQPTGACCATSGLCTAVTQAACGSGTWSSGTACSPNPCPQPTGTCCEASGACSVTTQASCAAAWTGGAACTPVNPCPQPSGSCCSADGSCAVTQQAACGGAWASGGACTPNPCPPPTGACCAADGSCAATAGAACAGSFQGAGVACAPGLCPLPSYPLTVSVAGPGGAGVSSAPVGVDCPAVCSAAFTSGTQVTLTAAAAARGRFVGWSGACSGVGPCVLTVASATDVTATFRCKADFNGQGGVELLDIFTFLQAWFAGDAAADYNGQNGVDLLDIFGFLSDWFMGPC